MKSYLFIVIMYFPLLIVSQSKPIEIIEKQSAKIVQRHIEPFNDRDLDGFINVFDSDILVTRFPNDTMYFGRNKLKDNYLSFFQKNKKTHVTVLNRMTLKNMVIDEELGTINQTTNRHITIYKTTNESIKSMTFINNSETTSNPESIVNTQLEAYNKRDIDAFVNTYSSHIKLYRFPDNLFSEGHDTMRKIYAPMFKTTQDLNAQIVNRIVLGNKVIDKEKVTANGNTFYAIAIYEVQDGKISKVTFIQ